MKQLIDYDITAYRAHVAVDSGQVAKLVVRMSERPEKLLTSEECQVIRTCLEQDGITDPEEAIVHEFVASPESKKVLCNIASRCPVDPMEAVWGRTDIRRCPARVHPTPAGGVSCLICSSEFYTITEKDEERSEKGRTESSVAASERPWGSATSTEPSRTDLPRELQAQPQERIDHQAAQRGQIVKPPENQRNLGEERLLTNHNKIPLSG